MEQEIDDVKKRKAYRVIFYALLEAASRYREGFWREDIEETQLKLVAQASKYEETMFVLNKPVDKGYWKRITEKNKAIMADYVHKQEMLNKAIYGAIEAATKNHSEQSAKAFDNYSTAFGMMAEELINAKNKEELLILCKMYNEGKFDDDFKAAKEQAYEKPKEDVVDGDHLRIEKNFDANAAPPVAEQVVKGGNDVEN